MIELVKFELKKIFDNKILFIAALGVAFFIAGISIMRNVQLKDKLGTRDEVKAMAEKYISDDYSKEDIDRIHDEAADKLYKNEEVTKEEYFIDVYSNCFSKNEKDENEKNIEKVEKQMKELEEDNKENTFEYSNLSKEKEMLQALPEKESTYVGDWIYVLDFNVAATMKLILLVLGLAGIYSKEYTSKVSYINLSTKKGKTKLNTAKLIAAMIYATTVFIFVTVLYHISTLYLGLPNGDKPISYLMKSVYNISINKYYMGTLAFSYFGTLVISLFIVLVSLLSKNIIVSFGLPIALDLLPDIFHFSDSIDYYVHYINFSRLFRGKEILGKYVAFNIFGKTVLYPYVITCLAVLAIGIMLIIYKRCGRKQVIV